MFCVGEDNDDSGRVNNDDGRDTNGGCTDSGDRGDGDSSSYVGGGGGDNHCWRQRR